MTEIYRLKRERLYDDLGCPESVKIPTNDFQAYNHPSNRQYRWVYNKLAVAESQNIPCGPIGIRPSPDVFPVIVKPIINLYGMGFHAYKFETLTDYRRDSRGVLSLPGLFWSRFFTGRHQSVDFLLKNGHILWYGAFEGIPNHEKIGQFKYWMSIPRERYRLPKRIQKWLKTHLKGYTGCVNIEIIGGHHIIECHLRMGDINHLDNNDRLLKIIIRLYAAGDLSTKDRKRLSTIPVSEIFLIPVFLTFDEYRQAKALERSKLLQLCTEHGIRTLEIDPPPTCVTYPSSGVRVYLLTTKDLYHGLVCCDVLKENLLQRRNACVIF